MNQLQRQKGELSLFWVAICSAGVALVAMAALFSMRYDRNLFKEAYVKVVATVAGSPAKEAVDSAKQAVTGAAPVAAPASAGQGPLRKCVINGKTVISNTDCNDKNPTAKDIKVQHTAGIESPKMPASAAASAEPTSNPAIDKAIEKQLR